MESKNQYSYVRGHWIKGHRWWYYLYGTLVKSSPIVLILFSISVILFCCSFRRANLAVWIGTALCICGILAVYLTLSFMCAQNHHVRYVLPCWGLVIIVAGLTASCKGDYWRYTVYALVCCSVISSVANHPNHLSYFNLFSGGRAKGLFHLSHSNVDWGQYSDLAVKEALKQARHEKIYLVSTGSRTLAAESIRNQGLYEVDITGARKIISEWPPQRFSVFTGNQILLSALGRGSDLTITSTGVTVDEVAFREIKPGLYLFVPSH